ncbi:MAG TPA: PEP-CTERM sorting domain-containing protein [Candidatus Dormibacteraeota bacterium]|nr:PEP-CTERM sorting domain-containing protein [Candidatus Dormibacteraeota bacterium]
MQIHKKFRSSFFALLLACAVLSARASITYSPGVNNINTIIPDGDLTGVQSSLNLSGLAGTITDVNVSLNIAGGFNGDYYAYLTHNSSLSILLNRPGRTSSSSVGYPDGGFGPDSSANRFLFDDQAAHDVHLYRTFPFTLNAGELTGTWQPDGRAIDPLSSGATFDSAGRSAMLSLFNTADPNGTWTLFVADVSSGGEGTLVSWSMDITTSAIPEPSVAAFLVLGAVGAWIRRKRA